ncbi:MAG TPA: large conductance mechanosensitive channel protein MscL [Anaerolineae bacterium]|nr:large conductance mechanosensitive channel protein MscL [Anaerolineae bacterium]
MWKDFKDFVMRGNVLDLAVAVIIGAAFGVVISSLVNDILMPPIGMLLGGVDFSSLFVNLGPGTYASLAEAQAAGAPTINYGLFINNVITFIIVALAVFLVVRAVKRLQRPAVVAPATTRPCPECLSEIPIGAHRCAHCTVVLE